MSAMSQEKPGHQRLVQYLGKGGEGHRTILLQPAAQLGKYRAVRIGDKVLRPDPLPDKPVEIIVFEQRRNELVLRQCRTHIPGALGVLAVDLHLLGGGTEIGGLLLLLLGSAFLPPLALHLLPERLGGNPQFLRPSG